MEVEEPEAVVNKCVVQSLVVVVIVVGLGFLVVAVGVENAEVFAAAVSRVLGWIYTFCWSASFYPQLISNYRRRSTRGQAIGYPTNNVIGFFSYLIYTSTLLYSPVIRDQYAARNPVSPNPTVRFNDFAFTVHALILSLFTYSQFWPRIWGFKVSKSQRLGKTVFGICCGCILSLVVVLVVVVFHGGYDPSTWAWLDLIYTFSYVKLVVTIVKYIPQAWVNYKRKSTVGWEINPMLLDLAGGILSIMQLVIDSSFQGDWSGITGNPVKFGLGNITIIFDLILIVQHYILYRIPTHDKMEEVIDHRTPLLPDRERIRRY
ncbi:hypothetical protein FQN54_008243 [Arachnomyces sp. PD_36]|nr:hypothetical protein FQN54_008243 [Arachnomyces sp. PD_36]